MASPTRIQRMMLEPARNAERRGDDVAAFREYRSAAQRGLAYAQYTVARFYEQGRGTQQDDAEAARWYQAASDQGFAEAHRNLARMYEDGRGVPQDDAKALALYRKAAASGDASAEFKVGPVRGAAAAGPRPIPWRRCRTIAPRQRRAWSTRSWRWPGCSGPTTACPRTRKGRPSGTPKPPAQLEVEARSGDAQASEQLGRAVPGRSRRPQEPGQSRGAVRGGGARRPHRRPGQARAALQKGADGVAADPAKAAEYFQMASDQGHRGASYALAQMYGDGEGVPQDGARAVALYEASVEQGETRAYARLGDLYAKGEAVRQDHVEAVRWYTAGGRAWRPQGPVQAGRGLRARPGRVAPTWSRR